MVPSCAVTRRSIGFAPTLRAKVPLATPEVSGEKPPPLTCTCSVAFASARAAVTVVVVVAFTTVAL